LETRKPYVIGACLLVLAFTGMACKGKRVEVQNEEPNAGAPRLFSTFRMNDATAAGQLLSGFYPVEANAWRWTGRKFSVLLRNPPGAAQTGGNLSLNFTIPDVSIQQLKSVTLSAGVNGMMLKSQEYTAGGTQVFTADVPASMLAADSVKVDFALDRSIPPGVDKRDLGIVAASVGLAAK
jgi:hypothetical protein